MFPLDIPTLYIWFYEAVWPYFHMWAYLTLFVHGPVPLIKVARVNVSVLGSSKLPLWNENVIFGIQFCIVPIKIQTCFVNILHLLNKNYYVINIA